MHKRRHGRIRTLGLASMLKSDARTNYGLSVENLSMGGAFVRAAEPMRVGTAVLVDLVRPGLKKSLQIPGRVVTCLHPKEAAEMRLVPGMGIQFDPLPEELETRLNQLLKAIAPGLALLDGDAPDDSDAPPAREVVDLSPPPAKPQAAVETAPQSERLLVQVRGLLMELQEAQTLARKLERENERLVEENEKLKAQLKRR